MDNKNAVSLRKVIIFLLIFVSLVVITFEASHYARATTTAGYTADQIMAPLDQGYDSQSEVDTSFDNTWWCQEASCEIDYGAIGDDPRPRSPIRLAALRSATVRPAAVGSAVRLLREPHGRTRLRATCLDDPWRLRLDGRALEG